MPARPRSPLALVRPAAALVAALLVGGVALTAPAAADETAGPALTLAVTADGLEGGASADRPAALGSSPASAALTVLVTNTGTEPVSGLDVATTVVSNGSAGTPVCEQGPSAVVEPGTAVRCAVTVSGVVAGSLHEDDTTATARTVADGVEVAATTRFYATSVDGPVTVGDRVWLDADADGRQDDGEPGLAGVRLVLTGPDGLAVPDPDAPGQVHGPQTSAQDGSYAFTRLPALPDGGRYTVAVDPTSAVLDGLVPTTGGSVTSAALAPGERDLALDFGFVAAPPPPPAKAPVALTVDASPEPAVVGSTITVKGTVLRAGRAFTATTVLEHADDGSGTWTKVASVKAGKKGTLSATTKAVRSGSFRFRYAGSGTTEAGVSPSDRVEVRLAAVRLTVSAPSSVTKGKAIRVAGSIKREGKGYKAETALEFRASGDDGWRRVKTVRSSSKGALSASVTPSGSGDYRYRYAGNGTTTAGASGADHVVVKPKPPAKPKPKKYKNCTALTKVYPHGVGRSGAKDKGGDVTDFVRDTKTYNLNTKSDRDKDGIACER